LAENEATLTPNDAPSIALYSGSWSDPRALKMARLSQQDARRETYHEMLEPRFEAEGRHDDLPKERVRFSSRKGHVPMRFRVHLIASLVPALLFSLSCSDGGSSGSSAIDVCCDGTKIAFTSTRDGNAEIYVMDADGSNQTNLTNDSGDDTDAAWSPDGETLAFSSRRGARTGIWTMNADGSAPVELTFPECPNQHRPQDTSPVWSDDGTQIAFTSDRQGSCISPFTMLGTPCLCNADCGSPFLRPACGNYKRQIWTMGADGTNLAPLTGPGSTQAYCTASNDYKSESYDPSWSETSEITFTSDRGGSCDDRGSEPEGTPCECDSDCGGGTCLNYAVDIYTMETDGSNPQNITSNTSSNREPAWSPDASQIAFTRFIAPVSNIYLMDPDGSQQTNISNDLDSNGSPAWSPDGSQIAFGSTRSGNNDIYVMEADGSTPTRITSDPASDYSPAWQPDP